MTIHLPGRAAPAPEHSSELSRILAEQAERDAAEVALHARNKEVLFDGLRLVGIAHVLVSFDGSGALVQEQAEHQGEKAALGRQEFLAHANTPWGPSQGAVRYGEGVVFHSTSGHGGFHLTADRNAEVHPLLRATGGWYEEDAAWAAVATAWPDLFTGLERRQSEETLRHSWPDAWEAIHGRALKPGESRTRDGEAFARDHSTDWVAISAIYSDQHRGFTEVIATRGGRRDPKSEERRFLVPSGDYKVGAFGFVIDEASHAVYDGPSSFLGWRVRAGG